MRPTGTRAPLSEAAEAQSLRVVVQWTFIFGGVCGASYALVRPVLPASPEIAGAIFGLAFAVVTHVGAIPAYRLAQREPPALRLRDVVAAVGSASALLKRSGCSTGDGGRSITGRTALRRRPVARYLFNAADVRPAADAPARSPSGAPAFAAPTTP